MNSTTQLPPSWQPNPDLKQLLPDTHDWRSFSELRENPRYLVCVNGSGIWDTQDNRFITPTRIKGRNRYFINMGANTKPNRLWYSRIIASLVFTASHEFNSQAHHRRRTIEGDNWQNLRWQSPKQNQAIETERAAATRQAKPTDHRHKLSHWNLALFIRQYDELKRQYRDPANLSRFARLYKVSIRQLQRIVAGQTRAGEVAAIRAELAAKAAAHIAATTLPDRRNSDAYHEYLTSPRPSSADPFHEALGLE